MKYPEEIYNDRFSHQGRTLFFDVKAGPAAPRRLVITQSRMKNGERIRERLTLYEEDVAPFVEQLLKAVAALGAPPPEGGADAEPFAVIRRTHPRAYMPWTGEDDRLLIAGYRAGEKLLDLSQRLGRGVGALRSRLEKLGELSPPA